MAVIDSILNEEQDRLVSLRARLAADLATLIPGSISIKVKGHRLYAYRAYRHAGRVITDYLGPVDSIIVKAAQEASARRQALVKELRLVDTDLRRIRRMMHT